MFGFLKKKKTKTVEPSYDKFEYDRFEFDKFEYEKFEPDRFEPSTTDNGE